MSEIIHPRTSLEKTNGWFRLSRYDDKFAFDVPPACEAPSGSPAAADRPTGIIYWKLSTVSERSGGVIFDFWRITLRPIRADIESSSGIFLQQRQNRSTKNHEPNA
jgi:hypothetical protein